MDKHSFLTHGSELVALPRVRFCKVSYIHNTAKCPPSFIIVNWGENDPRIDSMSVNAVSIFELSALYWQDSRFSKDLLQLIV